MTKQVDFNKLLKMALDYKTKIQLLELIKKAFKEEFEPSFVRLHQSIDDVLLGQEQIKAKLDRLEHKLDLIHNSLGINKAWSVKRIAKG